MSKLRLGVIFGGQSSEYSVSLHSVASFLRQIHADNYDMTLIGINKNGHFYLYNGDVDSIEHDTWQSENQDMRHQTASKNVGGRANTRQLAANRDRDPYGLLA